MAIARITGYHPEDRTLRLHEKGGKHVSLPVPHELAELIDAAIAAGVYDDARERGLGDYLIPSRALQRRKGDRSDKVIWHIVRKVATRAGVVTHVHAFRSAFADLYLEQYPGQIEALKESMLHKRLETTNVYVRRKRRRKSMETVRDLSWAQHRAQIAQKTLESLPGTEKEGFEPSMEVYTPITP